MPHRMLPLHFCFGEIYLRQGPLLASPSLGGAVWEAERGEVCSLGSRPPPLRHSRWEGIQARLKRGQDSGLVSHTRMNAEPSCGPLKGGHLQARL